MNHRNRPATLKNRSRSLIVNLHQGHIEMHLWWKLEHPELTRGCLSWLQAKVDESLKLPCDLENRSRSLTVKLPHDLLEMHLWGKFEPPELRTLRVSWMTSQSGQII